MLLATRDSASPSVAVTPPDIKDALLLLLNAGGTPNSLVETFNPAMGDPPCPVVVRDRFRGDVGDEGDGAFRAIPLLLAAAVLVDDSGGE